MNNSLTDLDWIFKDFKEEKKLEECKQLFSMEICKGARKFHMQIPDYKMTRLAALPRLSDMLKLGGIFIKDESERLTLNSFKVMGGSFAIFKFIQTRLKLEPEKLSYEYLNSEEVKKRLGVITFASATDGNHGRGIAWAATKLGHKCEIYVHEGTSSARINAIKNYGANVKIVKGNYDDAVRKCMEDSKKNGWEIISDTSWDGYTQVPSWIMQGYTTMMLETQQEFTGVGIIKPTHVFVQAGVGALAASVIGFYHSLFGADAPKCIVVEPDNAACLFESAKIDDGEPHNLTGKLDTIMAGLSCGDPSPIAWSILKNTVDCFIKAPDYVAARGMRIMATPLKDDPFIISGESGAVTLGVVYSIMTEPGCEELKEKLGLDCNSQILLINTEGNTDPKHFRQIIWDGRNPVPRKFWTER